jgi:hypothetical protein
MPKPIFNFEDNPIQEAFVKGDEAFSAYIGGVGAGKTFANIVRTLLTLNQPHIPIEEFRAEYPDAILEKPRGLIGAESYPALDDIIMPQWEKIQHQIKWVGGRSHPLAERPGAGGFSATKRNAYLNNGATIQFRSLDKPNSLRGRELTCFGIDEGRNVPKLAWDRLFDRLRQAGYRNRRGFVTSTPAGYDWMYWLFHQKSSKRGADPYTGQPFVWYNASTAANKRNLDPVYIASLKGNLSGQMLKQEFYGEFVGTTEGAVFPNWVPDDFLTPTYYDPEWPLYSFWDWGIADPGVCTWGQVVWNEKKVDNLPIYVPSLHILGGHEEADWNAKDWAEYYHYTLRQEFGRTRTQGDFGDPSGRSRTPGSGTSVIQDLQAAGVPVSPAPKKPEDYGIRILTNMIDGGRLRIHNSPEGEEYSQALASHKWGTDKSGMRKGEKPVHDWTSHRIATLRYAAASLLSFFPRRGELPPEPTPGPGTIGHALQNITKPPDSRWLGGGTSRRANWGISAPVGR